MDQFIVEMYFGDGSQDEQTVSATGEHDALGKCLYMDADYVTITRVKHPSDWERYGGARVGDIWEAEGREYFARQSRTNEAHIKMDSADATPELPGRDFGYVRTDLSDFKVLNPRLVRRRGVTIEG